jgi:hypothetical protein
VKVFMLRPDSSMSVVLVDFHLRPPTRTTRPAPHFVRVPLADHRVQIAHCPNHRVAKLYLQNVDGSLCRCGLRHSVGGFDRAEESDLSVTSV